MQGTERASTERASWSTRRKVLIALAALTSAALSFLAGTGGELDWLTGRSDGGFDDGSGLTGDWERAETVAVDDDGRIRATVEVAPARDADATCIRVQLGDEVANQECATGPATPWDDPDFRIIRIDDYFGSLSEAAVEVDDEWVVALSGSVHPDVVRITAHFGGGSQYSFVTRDPGGWFVTLLPDEVADPAATDRRLIDAPVRLELFDAAGTRVASVDLPAGSRAG